MTSKQKSILKWIEDETGYTLEQLKERDRTATISTVRSFAMYVLPEHGFMAKSKVAELFEREESLVRHAKKRVLSLLDEESHYTPCRHIAELMAKFEKDFPSF